MKAITGAEIAVGVAALIIALYFMTKPDMNMRYTAFSTVSPDYNKTNNTLILPKKDFISNIFMRIDFMSRGCVIKYDLETELVINCPEGLEIAGAYKEETFTGLDTEAVQAMNGDNSINAPYKGYGVTIAILDSGIETSHPEFFNSIAGGKYFGTEAESKDIEDFNGHGTYVAGIITADGIKNARARGIAPSADIWVGKVCMHDIQTKKSVCQSSDVLAAIDYVVTKKTARIISMSIGSKEKKLNDCDDEYEAKKINWAASQGVVVVVAAGNFPEEEGLVGHYSCASQAITVSNSGMNGVISSDSSYGKAIDISAVGLGVISTWIKGEYAAAGGTSAAAPQVSGLIALLLEKKPQATVDEIKRALYFGADDKGSPGKDIQYGYGFMNIRNSLALIEIPTLTTITQRTTTTQRVTTTTVYRTTTTIYGQCTNECVSTLETKCQYEGSSFYYQCGNFDNDNCLEWEQSSRLCPSGKTCKNNECQSPTTTTVTVIRPTTTTMRTTTTTSMPLTTTTTIKPLTGVIIDASREFFRFMGNVIITTFKLITGIRL